MPDASTSSEHDSAETSNSVSSPPATMSPTPPVDRQAFPRSHWDFTDFSPLPIPDEFEDPRGRTAWAAYRASRAVAKRLESREPIDALMYRLAVFDKTFEINKSEWPRRETMKYIHERHWMAHVREIVTEVLMAAAATLAAHGLTVPPDEGLQSFVESAMHICWYPLVDSWCRGEGFIYTREALGDFDPSRGILTADDLRDFPGEARSTVLWAQMGYDHEGGTGWTVVESRYLPTPPIPNLES